MPIIRVSAPGLVVGLLAGVLALLAGLVGVPAAAAQDPPGPPPFVELADDGAPVLRFVQGFGEAAEGEIVLEAWADGRVVVDRPEFIQGPPRSQARLDLQEIHGLVQALLAHGVADFDAAATRREVAAARRAQRDAAKANPGAGEIHVSSDPEPTRLELRLARLGRQGAAGPVEEDVTIAIEWTGLIGDARRHPEMRALQGLLASHAELRRFLEREELR